MTTQYITGTFFSLTDRGLVREANEDSVLTKISPYGEIILAVADGMGGRNKGDYASKHLLSFIEKEFENIQEKFKTSKQISKWLYKTINKANQEIFTKSKDNPEFAGMGSTLSLVYVSGKFLVIAQVGDSRIYSIDNNKLVQLSVDQSYVQYLEHSHVIKEEEIKSHPERHKITNAIGIRFDANVDFKVFPNKGQKIMICSDGIYNNVSEGEISSILKSGDSPERKCRQFVNFGNANGGSDNMAVIVWEAD